MEKDNAHIFDDGEGYKYIFRLDDETNVLAMVFYPLGMAHERDDSFDDTWDIVEAFWGKYGPPRLGDMFRQDNGSLIVGEITFSTNMIFIDFLATS